MQSVERLSRLSALLLFALPLVVGCNVEVPRLRNPGHRYTQQLRATYHDPYADIYAAPPFHGSRPRDFQVPRAEPVESQWFGDPIKVVP